VTLDWRRIAPLSVDDDRGRERWIDPDGRELELHATYGNPLDIVALKSNIVSDFRGKIDAIRESRTALYTGDRMESVEECPACEASTADAAHRCSIYEARYNQCARCGHAFVNPRPTTDACEEFYAESAQYSSTYTDIPSAMQRVAQIGMPRVRWMTETFERRFGRKPERVLDVGAGGGHFVRACRDVGLEAEGVEISESSRAFARDHFDIELLAHDFTTDFDFGEPDVITFWGVLEHVTSPSSFVRAAARRLKADGMIAAAVPRWNCLDTATQSVFSDSVVRFLDPLGHIHIFSDRSLAHLFSRFELDPIAVWYFGMDAYELLMQCGLRSEDPTTFDRVKAAIPTLQTAIDRAVLSDEIALAVVPRGLG
jgi:2-polyprenyl-3-methyl-5-hydroxy-6-metoxy-1,4-benzoquinol methylase